MDKKQVNKLHIESLNKCDDDIRSRGFKRAMFGTNYVKKSDVAKLEIEMFFTTPRFSDDTSIAHIAPMVRVSFGSVEQLFDQAMAAVPGHVARKTKYCLNLGLGLIGPEGCHKEWRPVSEQDYLQKVCEIVVYVKQHAIPFLDRYSTPLAIAKGFREGKEELPRTDPWMIMAMCCAIESGKPELSEEIFEQKLRDKPGLLKKYEPAKLYLAINQRGRIN